MNRILVVLLVAATLSGCADEPATIPDESVQEHPNAPESITIRGIVQDGSVTPIANARVTIPVLDLETTTDATGLFSFLDVPSGNGRYVVQANATNFHGAQLTFTGDELLFVLQRFQQEAFEVTTQFNGIWQCAAEYLIITPNCDEWARAGGVSVFEGTSEFDVLTDANWKTIVVDLIWEGEHPGIAGLRTAVSGATDPNELTQYDKYGDWNGQESFTFRLEPGVVYDEGIPFPSNQTGLRFNVYPLSHGYHATCQELGGPCLLGVGAGVDIQFELFVTVFYAEAAPENWSIQP